MKRSNFEKRLSQFTPKKFYEIESMGLYHKTFYRRDKFCNLMFCAIGFFNEAATLESSSILIYSQLQVGLYTQLVRAGAA